VRAVAKIVAVVVAGLVALLGISVVAVVLSLRDPPFDPPALSPLEPGAPFRADRVVATDTGYVVAGVVGTSDPRRGVPCSGRFAVVFLDERGRERRATVLTDLERDRYCADSVEAVVAAPGGGLLVGGRGVRDGGPSALFPGKPSSDSEQIIVRLDGNGSPVASFGDRGAVRGHVLAGRIGDVVFTTELERLAADGSVHDDLVDAKPSYFRSRYVKVEGNLIVAVRYSVGLTFDVFERDASSVATYRSVHPPPAAASEPTVDLGEVSVTDTALLGGILYVAVRDSGGTRINGVDPRRLRVDFGFNGTGAVRLRHDGYVSSTKLLADGAGRLVVASTAVDRGRPGDRLHVLRLDSDGTVDRAFGGRVQGVSGEDVVLDPGVGDAIVDAAGRTLVLGDASFSKRDAPASLVRLDTVGALDTTFGDAGVAAIRRLRPCALPPARDTTVCRDA